GEVVQQPGVGHPDAGRDLTQRGGVVPDLAEQDHGGLQDLLALGATLRVAAHGVGRRVPPILIVTGASTDRHAGHGPDPSSSDGWPPYRPWRRSTPDRQDVGAAVSPAGSLPLGAGRGEVPAVRSSDGVGVGSAGPLSPAPPTLPGAAASASAVAAVTEPSPESPCSCWNARSAATVASSHVPVTSTPAPCARSRSWTQETDAGSGSSAGASSVGCGAGASVVGAAGVVGLGAAPDPRGAVGSASGPVVAPDEGRGAGAGRSSSAASSVRSSGGGMRVTSGRGSSGRGVTAGTPASTTAPPPWTSATTTASPPPVAAPTMPATATTSVTAPAPAATETQGVDARLAGGATRSLAVVLVRSWRRRTSPPSGRSEPPRGGVARTRSEEH